MSMCTVLYHGNTITAALDWAARLRSIARVKPFCIDSPHRSSFESSRRLGAARVTISGRSRYGGSLIGPSPIVKSPVVVCAVGAVVGAAASAVGVRTEDFEISFCGARVAFSVYEHRV